MLEIKSHPSHSTVRLLKTSLQMASIQPLHLKEPPNGEAEHKQASQENAGANKEQVHINQN